MLAFGKLCSSQMFSLALSILWLADRRLTRAVYGLSMVAKYGITDRWLPLARVVYDLRMVANCGKTDRWLARVVYGLRMVAKYGIYGRMSGQNVILSKNGCEG